jgi:hypothetical protein
LEDEAWQLGVGARERSAVEQWGEQVREVPVNRRDGFKVYTHHRWFAVPEERQRERRARFWQVLV